MINKPVIYNFFKYFTSHRKKTIRVVVCGITLFLVEYSTVECSAFKKLKKKQESQSTKNFHRLQNKFIGNSNMKRWFLESFKVSLPLTERWCSIRCPNSWPNISWHKRFDLGFWQTSKQFYRKLQYREKCLGEFQYLSHFSTKIVLYLFNKFCIFGPCTYIQFLPRFDIGLW